MEKRFEFCGFNLSNVEQAERWVHDNVKKINFGYWDFDKLTDLLNMQDEKINELEKEIAQLKFDCAMYKSANYLINDIGIDKAKDIMFQSEKKLKQSQNSKAIEELEKIIEYIRNCETEPRYWDISNFINNQITELRGNKYE